MENIGTLNWKFDLNLDAILCSCENRVINILNQNMHAVGNYQDGKNSYFKMQRHNFVQYNYPFN